MDEDEVIYIDEVLLNVVVFFLMLCGISIVVSLVMYNNITDIIVGSCVSFTFASLLACFACLIRILYNFVKGNYDE